MRGGEEQLDQRKRPLMRPFLINLLYGRLHVALSVHVTVKPFAPIAVEVVVVNPTPVPDVPGVIALHDQPATEVANADDDVPSAS